MHRHYVSFSSCFSKGVLWNIFVPFQNKSNKDVLLCSSVVSPQYCTWTKKTMPASALICRHQTYNPGDQTTLAKQPTTTKKTDCTTLSLLIISTFTHPLLKSVERNCDESSATFARVPYPLLTCPTPHTFIPFNGFRIQIYAFFILH